MADHDDFYDKLPFTLEDHQTNPQWVIFGTGLQETLIAAYKSKMLLKPGLIIDTQKTYGSALKTLTFKEFNQLTSLNSEERMYKFVTPEKYREGNQQFFDECVVNKKHRGYSIDIEPSLFLASSLTCQCLKQADMDKYMDFHLVKSILHISDNKMKHVPLSKGKIFESTDLSLIEKKHLLNSLHKLMKIYQKYTQVELDLNSTNEFDKDMVSIDENLYNDFLANLDKMFLPFVEKMVKKNKKIVNFLVYIICNYQYNYEKQIPEHAQKAYTLKGFITRFGKFIKSCGVYGQIPYLYVDNGIGDIPQAFSRIASIFASVYILHPKIEINSITKPSADTFEIVTNLSPEKPIKTKELFFGPTQLELRKVPEQFYSERILRVFVLAEKSGKQEECPAICFINQLKDFVNPVYVFLFDKSSHSCPSELMFYQFETIINQQTDEECQLKGQKLLDVLQGVYGQEFRKSIRYYSVYVRTRRYPKDNNTQPEAGIGLHDTMGIDLDQHFENFVGIVGQQESYFKKENPNQEQDQYYGGDDAKYILQRMDELNINAPPKQEQVHKTEDVEKKEDAPEQIQKTGQEVGKQQTQQKTVKQQQVEANKESHEQLKEQHEMPPQQKEPLPDQPQQTPVQLVPVPSQTQQ